MQIPQRVTPYQLGQKVTAWLFDFATRDLPDGLRSDSFRCKKCGGEIKIATVAFSIHAQEFGDQCSGAGKVTYAPVPWCPNCEGELTGSGCIHVPIAQACIPCLIAEVGGR